MSLSRFFAAILFVLCATPGITTGQDSSATVLRNARVFDGVTERLSGATDVLVVDGLIDSIGAGLNVPDGTKEINVGGRTLMPGLINAHAHVMLQLPVWQALTSDNYMFAYVATVAARSLIDNAFTSIRDMSGNSFSLKQAIDGGVLPGPRIFPSGAMISQTSGHSDHRTAEASSRLLDPKSRSPLEKAGMTIVADGQEQVLQAARENLRRGATQIKIAAVSYTHLTLPTITE